MFLLSLVIFISLYHSNTVVYSNNKTTNKDKVDTLSSNDITNVTIVGKTGDFENPYLEYSSEGRLFISC